jgi:DMSO/TMAO reductase YedYZ molybdopterin-dependent catalytic subunit
MSSTRPGFLGKYDRRSAIKSTRAEGLFARQAELEGKVLISMVETPISRGFRSRRLEQTPKNRVPPGQYVTTDFPVLSAGPTPLTKEEDWSLTLDLGGSPLGKWSWGEFEALPQTTIKTDIHCVTKWSKLDTTWQGVTFDDLLKAVGLSKPPAHFVMAHCDGGYTTNLPVADLIDGRGAIVTRYEGLPIPPAHGGPARLLAQRLYFWKSGKWVRRLRFMEKDERGFWESLGYHNYGDPWKEQRYEGD